PQPFSEQQQFYQVANTIATTDFAFSYTDYEDSPLNRTRSDLAAGESWAGNAGTQDQKAIRIERSVNAANEILLLKYDDDSGLIIDPAQHYGEGKLTKIVRFDENQHMIEEFSDKQGRTIAKKVEAPGGAWAFTHYVYDHAGNLVTVLPPVAVEQLNASPSEYFGKATVDQESFLKRWAFRYSYDERKRIVKKQVPGAEPLFLVYDHLDRLVLTQDGNQRADNQWTFTKYDALNRPILTGIYTHSSSLDQDDMQTVADAFYVNNPLFEERGGTVHGYTNQSFPNVGDEADFLTVSYYDDYNFDTPAGFDFDYDETELLDQDQEAEEFNRVKGQVTGTKVKNLGDGT